MNILLAISNYANLTGSEIYVYELARVLKSRGHEVNILANLTGGEITEKTRLLGIEVYNFFDHPDFKPDIIHSSQPSPATYCLTHFEAPLVCTIHSALIYERPIKDDKIKHYIAVRTDIKTQLLGKYELPEEKVSIILNGVDTQRFNVLDTEKKEAILFVGTWDYLRENTIRDLIARAAEQNKELWLVSHIPDRVKYSLPAHVIPMKPQWNVEEYNKLCSETASIFMGRTTIEGWMCGKPGRIYDIDEKGRIKDIVYTEVPEDLAQFDIESMTTRILEVYKKAI